jgi:peroxisomal 3,2-trans-enoyl-CoA isomerase
MSEDLVRLDINGIFAVITLNNPKSFNALTQSLYYRLASFLRDAEENPDVYVTVLIGEGPFFSA